MSAFSRKEPEPEPEAPAPTVEELNGEVDKAREEWREARVYSGGGSPHEAERRYHAAFERRRAFFAPSSES